MLASLRPSRGWIVAGKDETIVCVSPRELIASLAFRAYMASDVKQATAWLQQGISRC
jgi:hypothetical protein